jgi:hypothetical protein
MSMPGPNPSGPGGYNPYAAPGAPSYAQAPAVPGKVQAIAIMTLVGGILATIVGLIWLFYGLVVGLATFGIGCVICLPAIYSVTMGVMAIVKGAKLLGARGYLETPPKAIAIMQIVNIICCDVTNMVLGILTLVFLNDPYVRGYYRGV